jgi:hypothetical protein
MAAQGFPVVHFWQRAKPRRIPTATDRDPAEIAWSTDGEI